MHNDDGCKKNRGTGTGNALSSTSWKRFLKRMFIIIPIGRGYRTHLETRSTRGKVGLLSSSQILISP